MHLKKIFDVPNPLFEVSKKKYLMFLTPYLKYLKKNI